MADIDLSSIAQRLDQIDRAVGGLSHGLRVLTAIVMRLEGTVARLRDEMCEWNERLERRQAPKMAEVDLNYLARQIQCLQDSVDIVRREQVRTSDDLAAVKDEIAMIKAETAVRRHYGAARGLPDHAQRDRWRAAGHAGRV